MQRDWRYAVAILALAVLVIGAGYAQAIVHAAEVWASSATYQSAYLVLGVVAYLIWNRRGELAAIRPRPSLFAVALAANEVFNRAEQNRRQQSQEPELH